LSAATAMMAMNSMKGCRVAEGAKKGYTTHEEPSSKGLSSISRSRSLPSEKWAMAMAQRKLYEIILHKFSGRNLLLALLVFAPAIQSPWPDLLAAPQPAAAYLQVAIIFCVPRRGPLFPRTLSPHPPPSLLTFPTILSVVDSHFHA